ncbi:holin [Escherichia phage FL04]
MQVSEKGKDFAISNVLRAIFTTKSTELLVLRVFAAVVLSILAFVVYSKNELFALYKETRYETYAHVLQVEKDRNFDNAAQEQLQIVHVSADADFSAVFSFRPKNLNYFVDLVAYEGKLPHTIDEKNLGGFPINKTSEEYRRHLLGKSYFTDKDFQYIPSREKKLENIDIGFMYSCPIFNLDNVYSGSIAISWKNKPDIDIENLDTLCNQSARILGRIR